MTVVRVMTVKERLPSTPRYTGSNPVRVAGHSKLFVTNGLSTLQRRLGNDGENEFQGSGGENHNRPRNYVSGGENRRCLTTLSGLRP
jgi:hypothetical protein